MTRQELIEALDREFVEGYLDGRCKDDPEPGANRSAAYRHSFQVGRKELANDPIPASLSKERAAKIEAEFLRTREE